MCQLCSDDPNEKETAVNEALYHAQQLEQIAQMYRALARGHIKPHTQKFAEIEPVAKSTIRWLVHDWV